MGQMREAVDMDTSRRRDWTTDLGIIVVGLAAAILTFTTLRGLAETVGFRDSLFGVLPLAWLLPVTIDAAGVVAARVWLRELGPREAVDFARRLTWACILGSVAGNAGAHVMTELAITPPWPVIVLVTGVPAATLGAVVHLGHLVNRTGPGPGEETGPEQAATAQRHDGMTAPAPLWAEYLESPTVVIPAVQLEALDRSDDGPETGPALVAHLHPGGGPAADMTDEQLIESIQKWANEIGRIPSRKLITDKYRIGRTRYDRIREQVTEPERLRAAQ